ncbi:hypothetical protein JOD29_001216 [Lysinibacillus composti]|uniref:YviE n=1 Tax=Lysinibacillus composti TaxID=720633 RepID=A0A3N9UGZ8_9BACI|nr:DUF6470 family protein [Lysinibacillus composti]MBM7607972.1 hypothetical protein [Lysinibacillus composti]RQW75433.1 hypothetical protein EBB45_06720 [Lysinibacillus composti]
MNIPKLQIQSTKAQIGLTIQKPVQEIQQPKANLDLQQPKAILKMETTKSKLSIDTTEARADLDLKSSRRRTSEVAQHSQEEAMNGIARRAQEGNELMRIENGGNPIASHASNWGKQPYSSLNIKFVPSAGSVKVNFEPGNVDIQVEQQKVINNSKANKPIHNYTPGKVKVEMLQDPSMKIDWLV